MARVSPEVVAWAQLSAHTPQKYLHHRGKTMDQATRQLLNRHHKTSVTLIATTIFSRKISNQITFRMMTRLNLIKSTFQRRPLRIWPLCPMRTSLYSLSSRVRVQEWAPELLNKSSCSRLKRCKLSSRKIMTRLKDSSKSLTN